VRFVARPRSGKDFGRERASLDDRVRTMSGLSRFPHRSLIGRLERCGRMVNPTQEVDDMLHRILSLLAAAAAVLALTATPALAQDDDDDDDDDGGVGQTAPQGGVQTGAGGTAEPGPDWALAGLAAGSLVLVAGAGGLALRRRETP
jgi:hypothetical protein